MTAREPEDAPCASKERIAMIADAIVSAYGEDAMLVAQRQLDVSDHPSRADWTAILDRLQHR